MSSRRSLIFQNDQIYHVFNRGVERRPIFLHKSDYVRACNILEYYSTYQTPIKYSDYCKLSPEKQKFCLDSMTKNSSFSTLSYCFMPNHFHLLLRQHKDFGIQNAMMRLQTSYVKFFNTKYDRVGPLFQGEFKAVHIESDEQLVHVSRYIHLNPVVSGIVHSKSLESYIWSSFPCYLDENSDSFVKKSIVIDNFQSVDSYKSFVFDQINYVKKLDTIKHLTLED